MVSLAHIHPMIVHFPIVFILCLAVFDTVAAVRGSLASARNGASRLSLALAVLAALSALVAVYFGDQALSIAEAGGFESDIAEIHEHLGMLVALALVLWAGLRAFLWWRKITLPGVLRFAIPAVEIAGAAVVITTAYFGGQLVFDLGVNVSHLAGA